MSVFIRYPFLKERELFWKFFVAVFGFLFLTEK